VTFACAMVHILNIFQQLFRALNHNVLPTLTYKCSKTSAGWWQFTLVNMVTSSKKVECRDRSFVLMVLGLETSLNAKVIYGIHVLHHFFN